MPKRCRLPFVSVPFHTWRPPSEPSRTISSVSPLTARTSSPPARAGTVSQACSSGSVCVAAAPEAPRGDHERSDDGDPDQREPDDVRLELATPASLPRRGRGAGVVRRPPLEHLVAGAVADVVLVHVQLAVEAEVVRIGAEEALDVGRPGQLVERLVLERAQVLRADLRALLELGEVELFAHARLAKAVTDLEHGGPL